MGSTHVREKLIEFNADYVRCIDSDQLERWPSFFAEQCHYRITTEENLNEGLQAGLVYANSRSMLVDRISALRNANIYERQKYRHVVGLPTPSVLEGQQFECETPFLIVRIVQGNETFLYTTGIYKDVYQMTDDSLQLVSRIVVCDSFRFDTLLAVPL